MSDNIIDGEVVPEEVAEEPQGMGPDQQEQEQPEVRATMFGFSDRVIQDRASIQKQVQERIRKHEEFLTEEELELWELRLTGHPTDALEEKIKNRRTLIAVYAQEHNTFFEQSASSDE